MGIAVGRVVDDGVEVDEGVVAGGVSVAGDGLFGQVGLPDGWRARTPGTPGRRRCPCPACSPSRSGGPGSAGWADWSPRSGRCTPSPRSGRRPPRWPWVGSPRSGCSRTGFGGSGPVRRSGPRSCRWRSGRWRSSWSGGPPRPAGSRPGRGPRPGSRRSTSYPSFSKMMMNTCRMGGRPCGRGGRGGRRGRRRPGAGGGWAVVVPEEHEAASPATRASAPTRPTVDRRRPRGRPVGAGGAGGHGRGWGQDHGSFLLRRGVPMVHRDRARAVVAHPGTLGLVRRASGGLT